MNLSDLCLHSPHCLQKHPQHDQQHHHGDHRNQAIRNKNSSSTPFPSYPQQLPVFHPSHYQMHNLRQWQPLQQTNVQHQYQQHQEQQQHQVYRSNSRASSRCATITPTPSTSSDSCSDSEGIRGGLRGGSYSGADTVARSKNPDQMIISRSRSVDNGFKTAIEFSKLFISPISSTDTTDASPTPSAPIATSTAAVAAVAVAKMALGRSNQDDNCSYYDYNPPRLTATSISPGVEGGGRREKSRADGPRPSWPPSRRFNNAGYYPP
ncbi:hypothetical protein BKA57DRAFT_503094 [Linnemannia elongata]|nr:hypothetical protein BKA57DRAFT_503094 [Linnemannia elongata]